ncbi:MAG: hypothetical protein JRE47_01845 [Deltaproteobacteria bacterium]|nr:hypothetical protein [Deltaproteobacteria bacterium]
MSVSLLKVLSALQAGHAIETIAAKLVESSSIPVILASGITPDNVYAGIMHVHPAGIDSCAETNAIDPKGRAIRFNKDFNKVKQFVENTR